MWLRAIKDSISSQGITVRHSVYEITCKGQCTSVPVLNCEVEILVAVALISQFRNGYFQRNSWSRPEDFSNLYGLMV